MRNYLYYIFVLLLIYTACDPVKKEDSNESKVRAIEYKNIHSIEIMDSSMINNQQITDLKMVAVRISIASFWGTYGALYFSVNQGTYPFFNEVNDIEIIFSRGWFPTYYFVGIKLDSAINSGKAYIISWKSKDNIIEYGKSINKDSIDKAKSKINFFDPSNALINESTYSVKTSLSKEIFLQMFPKFNGEYEHINPDTLFFNSNYGVDNLDFYLSINCTNYVITKWSEYETYRSFTRH